MNLRLSLSAAAAAVTVIAATGSAMPHVHYNVHRTLQATGKVDIVVTMKATPTHALRELESTTTQTRGEKIEALVNHLDSHAAESQKDIEAIFAQEAGERLYDAQHRSWALNARLINGATLALVEKLAAVPGVESIREQYVARIPEVQDQSTSTANGTIEWGVDRIQAPRVWAKGNVGQNVVVGILDTGVRYTHKLVQDNIRDNYNWYDPSNQTDLPFDTLGHGTHVTGTILGSRGYGVAPGAKWTACLGCVGRSCPEFNLVKCGEYFTCPTDTKGENKDCSKAPHIINNSWGGGSGDSWYQPVVDAWQAAGIIPVFANGNEGPNCTTANSPGDYTNVIGVGATSRNETLAYFSSRGPAVNGTMKPDISAPGLYITSAWNGSDTQLANISGTSMATPHVTGAVALLLSAEPTLKYNDIYTRLTTTADQSGFVPTLSTGRGGEDTCGGILETVFPNNHYGFGRLNVYSASLGSRQSPAPSLL